MLNSLMMMKITAKTKIVRDIMKRFGNHYCHRQHEQTWMVVCLLQVLVASRKKGAVKK